MSYLIALLELANKVRKEFADSPSQFKPVLDEYVCYQDGSLSEPNHIIRIGFKASTLSSKMLMTSYRDWSLTAPKRRI
jgi:hypothetical protein